MRRDESATLFVAPFSILAIKPHIHPPVGLPSIFPPLASSSPPVRHTNLLTAPNLAQTSRIVMSAIQLSTFLTPTLINPLYTPEILVTLSSNFPVIRALGLANLSTTITLHAHRSLPRPCCLANTVAFATTAALYLAYRIKPAYVNLPFISTLALIAISNAVSLYQAPKSQATTACRLAPIAKFAAAAVALAAALSSSQQLSRVYLMQVALNLVVAAGVALCTARTDRILGIADAFALLGMAICLYNYGSLAFVVVVVLAALCTGWDALFGKGT